MKGLACVKPGEEQYEYYHSYLGKKDMCQYDYRTTRGKLFTCVRSTLEACRAARDSWLIEIKEA